jgi:cytoskeletal protein RodZ
MSETPQDPRQERIPEHESHETSASRGRETAGDILRKERVTRRVAIETIAKDLKLNVNYVKALESNNYDELPAEPYVRVYLRSIASYLMLDPEEILKHYCEDRGFPPDQYERERADTLTIKVSEREKSPLSWIAVVLVIISLAVLSYVANKVGWISPSKAEGNEEVMADTVTMDAEEVPEDSLEAVDLPVGVPIEDTLPEEESDEEETEADEEATTADEPDTLALVMTAVRDSVWAQVFTDGDPWKNFLGGGDSRVFRAADSLNVHVGNNQVLRYSLNGEPLEVEGKGVVYFKIDHDGLTYWRYGKWQRVFGGRL